MKLFDSSNALARAYLHFSYAFSMTFVVFFVRQMADVYFGRLPAFDAHLTEFGISLGVGTLLLCLMLYLHLPKMINRCFTIGRHFGL